MLYHMAGRKVQYSVCNVELLDTVNYKMVTLFCYLDGYGIK